MTVSSINPTMKEIQCFESACSKLWELDENRLTPGEDYELNLQEGKKVYQKEDVAVDPLFTFVKPEVFERRTFKLFHDLLDNYERGTGVAEVVTQEERRENWDFLSAICSTKPIQYAHKYLVKKGKFSGDINDFKKKLHELWFDLYRREVRGDSSGFEHVFVGETRDGQVTGCHNWIQIYNEERAGQLDYRGYIKPKNQGGYNTRSSKPHNREQLLTIQFSWGNEIKPVSTSFIGVSPEFEMALYTMCFLNGEEMTEVELGPYRCMIKCFSIGRGDRRKVGSIFPEALPMKPEQAATLIQSQFRGRKVRQQRESQAPPSAWGKPKAWGKPN